MKQNSKKYASAEQKLRLVHLVESDPQLKTGKFSESFTISEANNRWLAISQELNALPGTKKTWKEWRKTWQDKKSNVKKSAYLRRQAGLRDSSSQECPALADCIILQSFDQTSSMDQGVNRTSTKKYASAEQKHRLSRLVEADPQLKSGKFTKFFSKSEARRRWLAISYELNSLPGSKKTWMEWRKTWQDRKANAKKSAALCHLSKLRGTPLPTAPPSLAGSLVYQSNDQQYLIEHNNHQDTKPTLHDLSQPGTSEQHSEMASPTSDPGTPRLYNIRTSAAAHMHPEVGLHECETLTERLLKEKLETKKKFYEEFIRLMSMQTQALVDIAAALNNAASTFDVLQ